MAGQDAGRFAARMQQVQSVLGDHQDTVIARQLERRLGVEAHQAGESAFSYGLLYERDVCDGGAAPGPGCRCLAQGLAAEVPALAVGRRRRMTAPFPALKGFGG